MAERRRAGRRHGETFSGLALWVADASCVAGVHGDCDFNFGAGDWREYGAIFGGQWCAAESAGLSALRSARGSFWNDAGIRSCFDSLPEFSGLAAPDATVLVHGAVPQPGLQLHRHGSGGAAE